MEPRAPLVRGVTAIVRRVLLCGEFDPETESLQTLGATSLEGVHVQSLIEAEYGAILSFEELWMAPTVAAIADCLQSARRCPVPSSPFPLHADAPSDDGL